MKTPLEELLLKTVSNKLRKQRQVKAKKDTPLKSSFRRLKPDSTSDKILRDLIDSIKRSQRIANCLGGRIVIEFADTELQHIVEETKGIFLTITHTLESAANFAEEKFENKLHELLQRKLLPIIKSRGYN